MRRLSSIFKPRLRPWFALGIVAFLVSILLVTIWRDAHHRGAPPWMLIPALMPLWVGSLANARHAFAADMVDEAWIDGDELLLRRAGESLRMPLTNVATVQAASQTQLLTLTLSRPCALGSQVRFITPTRRASVMGNELQRRIEEARRRQA